VAALRARLALLETTSADSHTLSTRLPPPSSSSSALSSSKHTDDVDADSDAAHILLRQSQSQAPLASSPASAATGLSAKVERLLAQYESHFGPAAWLAARSPSQLLATSPASPDGFGWARVRTLTATTLAPGESPEIIDNVAHPPADDAPASRDGTAHQDSSFSSDRVVEDLPAPAPPFAQVSTLLSKPVPIVNVSSVAPTPARPKSILLSSSSAAAPAVLAGQVTTALVTGAPGPQSTLTSAHAALTPTSSDDALKRVSSAKVMIIDDYFDSQGACEVDPVSNQLLSTWTSTASSSDLSPATELLEPDTASSHVHSHHQAHHLQLASISAHASEPHRITPPSPVLGSRPQSFSSRFKNMRFFSSSSPSMGNVQQQQQPQQSQSAAPATASTHHSAPSGPPTRANHHLSTHNSSHAHTPPQTPHQPSPVLSARTSVSSLSAPPTQNAVVDSSPGHGVHPEVHYCVADSWLGLVELVPFDNCGPVSRAPSSTAESAHQAGSSHLLRGPASHTGDVNTLPVSRQTSSESFSSVSSAASGHLGGVLGASMHSGLRRGLVRSIPRWVLRQWLAPQAQTLAQSSKAPWTAASAKDVVAQSPVYALLTLSDLALVHALAEAVRPEDLDELALSLFRILEAGDRARDFVRGVIRHLIACTESPTVLFRANSLASKVLGIYFRALGTEYLQYCIAPCVSDVLSAGNLEIDPGRQVVGTCAVPPPSMSSVAVTAGADAAGHFTMGVPSDDAGDGIDADTSDEAVQRLDYVSRIVLTRILHSSDQLPHPLRFICSVLRSEVDAVFPGHGLRSVGSFLCLRFISPALVSPERMQYASTAAMHREQTRSLLLVGKVLQNLANGLEFGAKEMHMASLNAVLRDFREPMDAFLDVASTMPDNYCEMPIIAPPQMLEDALRRVLGLCLRSSLRLNAALSSILVVEECEFNPFSELSAVVAAVRRGLVEHPLTGRAITTGIVSGILGVAWRRLRIALADVLCARDFGVCRAILSVVQTTDSRRTLLVRGVARVSVHVSDEAADTFTVAAFTCSDDGAAERVACAANGGGGRECSWPDCSASGRLLTSVFCDCRVSALGMLGPWSDLLCMNLTLCACRRVWAF
jgi:hypothetical protein